MDPKALMQNPYEAYVEGLVNNVRTSTYVKKMVLFGVDECVDDAGCCIHKDSTVCASNDDLLSVYRKHADVVIPFFSINPRRPDALALIDKYTALGFRGAKFLQNYWNVDTRETRYRPYFEKLAALQLPLIVHVGNESSIRSYKACEALEMLDAPLAAGVTVIAAHMALSYDTFGLRRMFSKNPKYFNEEYFRLLEMLKVHENLYADISALLTPIRAKALRHLSQEYEVHDKLLFGTDFPVPFLTLLNSYDLPYKKRLLLGKEKNPYDRYSKVILEYFDETNPIYTNYQKILDRI
jgi:predicted TIM-barrel fold metal-dependent hydrolase